MEIVQPWYFAAEQGISTTAANLRLDDLFNELGFFKLVTKCDLRNTTSFCVMAKLAFVREAFLHNITSWVKSGASKTITIYWQVFGWGINHLKSDISYGYYLY